MNFRRAVRLTMIASLLGAVPLLMPLHAAMAQMSLGGTGGGAGGSDPSSDREAADAAAKAEAKAAAKAAAPPPAIPGAVTDEATATSGHMSADMEPTAALFDAINRGDMTSAKEALGRGADLNGKNVLGQSPIDMSIDLNRNDITFLLLSMRGNDGSGSFGNAALASADADAGATTTTHLKNGHLVVKGRSSRLAARETKAKAPQRLASDTGTPAAGDRLPGLRRKLVRARIWRQFRPPSLPPPSHTPPAEPPMTRR